MRRKSSQNNRRSPTDGSESFLPSQEVPKKAEKFALVNQDMHQRDGCEKISS